jgi:hypothetical protein
MIDTFELYHLSLEAFDGKLGSCFQVLDHDLSQYISFYDKNNLVRIILKLFDFYFHQERDPAKMADCFYKAGRVSDGLLNTDQIYCYYALLNVDTYSDKTKNLTACEHLISKIDDAEKVMALLQQMQEKKIPTSIQVEILRNI